jgi:hypothetical protein
MTEATNTVNIRKLAPVGGFIALIGFLAMAAAFGADKTIATQAYVFGWIFWALTTLGALGLTFLHHALRGSWGLAVIRLFEAASSPVSLVVTALGFIPIWINRALIFPWASHPHEFQHILERKAWYLNDNFFLLRFFIYFAIWIALSAKMRGSSFKQDETLDSELGVKRMSWGAVGMVIFFVSMTFAVSDWIMSIEPKWYSTLLPLLVCVGAGLSALSLCELVVLSNRDKEPYASILSSRLTTDLGNMCFALTMVWGYLTLSQYLITYSGNLPEEIPYYIKRNETGWQFLIGAIVVFQFFVPFVSLLASRVKRFTKNLKAVVILIFVVRIFEVYWTMMPSMRGAGVSAVDSMMHWQDWAAFVAFGGLWLALFGYQAHQASILPKHDTRLLELEHAH